MDDLYLDPTYKELAELAQLRQNDLSISCARIASRALVLSRTALVLRVVIIFLGALVAAKGITDQLMIEHPAIKKMLKLQDETLSEIQAEAAELGLNLIKNIGVDYGKFRGETD